MFRTPARRLGIMIPTLQEINPGVGYPFHERRYHVQESCPVGSSTGKATLALNRHAHTSQLLLQTDLVIQSLADYVLP
jgi:hypothetical protein